MRGLGLKLGVWELVGFGELGFQHLILDCSAQDVGRVQRINYPQFP